MTQNWSTLQKSKLSLLLGNGAGMLMILWTFWSNGTQNEKHSRTSLQVGLSCYISYAFCLRSVLEEQLCHSWTREKIPTEENLQQWWADVVLASCKGDLVNIISIDSQSKLNEKKVLSNKVICIPVKYDVFQHNRKIQIVPKTLISE